MEGSNINSSEKLKKKKKSKICLELQLNVYDKVNLNFSYYVC